MKPVLGTMALAGILFGIASYVSIARGNAELGVPLVASHLVLMVSIGAMLFSVILPKLIYRATADQILATVRLIRASGPPEGHIRTGGRVGRLSFRGPLLRITIYPDGIIVDPLLLTTFGVLFTDCAEVGFKSDWRSFGRSRLTIVHHSAQVASPIQLWCDRDHPFAIALISVAGEQTTARLAPTG